MSCRPGLTNGLYRTVILAVMALLLTTALAGCGSEPEPVSSEASTGAVDFATQSGPPAQPPAAMAEPAQAPPASPPQARPEPTAPPMATPLVVAPSPTRAAGAVIARAPQPTAPPAVAIAPPAPVDFDPSAIGSPATWDDVFNSFSEEEQSCIRSEMGEERLNQLLGLPFALEGLEDEPITVLNCISEEAAREILLANMAAQLGGLTDEREVCLRGLLGNFSPSDLAMALGGAEPNQEQALLLLSFGLGLATCLPEFAGSTGGNGVGGGNGMGGGPMVQDPSFLWSYSTGGWVVTAPVVVDGVVYAGSDDYSLHALDADTGNLRWSYATGDVIRSTPTVADGRVYFGSNDNHLYALDAGAGTEIWKFDTGEWVQHSPEVGGGKVYFGAYSEGDRKVHALDAATGEVVWVAEHPFPIGAEHSPTFIGDRVYAQGAEYGKFYALDAATGEVAWQAEVGGYVESSPTVLDGVVYLTVVNRAYAFREETGELIWEVNTDEFPARDFPALVVDGVYYLAPSGNVHALDAATGEQLWSYESFMLSTAPVVAGGVLYGASGDAEYIFAMDATSGAELWAETTEDFTTNALSVVDGTLYGELSSGELVAADAETGIAMWVFDKGGFSDLRGYTVKDGVVYSAGPNNSVYAHRAPESS